MLSESGYPADFEELWMAWPKRRTDSGGKKAAHTAWDRAVNGTTKRKARVAAAELLAAVHRYAEDPNLPPEQYQPNLTTWLNQDRWENGPLPERSAGRRVGDRASASMAATAQAHHDLFGGGR